MLMFHIVRSEVSEWRGSVPELDVCDENGEGVVLIDPEYVKDRKVFIHLLGAFRYGRDEVDLLGLNYHKDIYLSTKQAYPPPVVNEGNHKNGSTIPASPLEPPTQTRLQERLIRKLGANAYPFYFQLPAYSAPSVSLNLSPSDSSKPCRVDYELKVYVADNPDDKPQKRNSVRMIIRKLTYAPDEPGPQPSTEALRDFLMSVGSLRAEVSLDKQKYYHGEAISVNVLVDNNSGKSVKRIKMSVRQYTQICLHSTVNYKCTVAELQSDEGFPILPSQTGWCKVYRLCPTLAHNRDKVGVAMDGDLKHEDTNLASSTIDPPDSVSRDPIGIMIQYKVKVRLILGFGISDVCLELPFILTHPSTGETDIFANQNIPPCPTEPRLPNLSSLPVSVTPIKQQNAQMFADAPASFAFVYNGSLSNGNNHDMVKTAVKSPGVVQLNRNGGNLVDVFHSDRTVPPPLRASTKPRKPSSITLGWSNTADEMITHQRMPQSVLPRTPPCPTPVSRLGNAFTSSVDPMFGSFKSDRRVSTTGTQSTVSEEDMLFEDFARFRLHATNTSVTADAIQKSTVI
ncbi:unnamed protein product [Calicophoron daubneyi]|uniref:Arrestin C-terminal-like domain-containing protein n=1 Tax=Calicophoron daubneyi TaxID=300641 RepID=A0AAV2TDH1_CALDB